MALGQRIARAVLELTTDLTEFKSGLAQADQVGKTFAQNQQRTYKDMIAGMSAAGKEASASGRMIAGMSESGRIAAQKLVDANKPVVSSFSAISGIAKSLGPIMAASFSVGAVVSFAKELGSFAGKMTDLAAETGVGVERLQALNYVAAGVGLTVEDITTGITQLSKRLASGDDSAVAAIERLNLNVHQLQQMKPDEAFIKIGQAVAGIENPMERTRTSMELFGRSGSRMLRMMTSDMGEVIEAAEKTSAVLDKKLIEQADRFDDAWHQAVMRVKGYIASVVLGGPEDEIKPGSRVGERKRTREAIDLFLRTQGGVKSPIPAGGLFGTPGLPSVLSRAELEKTIGTKSTKELAAEAQKASLALANFTKELAKFQSDEFRELAKFAASGVPESVGSDFASSVRGFTIGAPELAGRRVGGLAGLPVDLRSRNGFGIANALDPAKGMWRSLGTNLTSQLGPTLMAAITGGGNKTHAIGGLIGGQLGQGLAGKLTASLVGKSGLSKMLGEGLASALPGIGTLIGPAIAGLTKLFGKMFGGPSQKELEGREAAGAFRKGLEQGLNATQKAEAGNDKWKQSVIAIRDAYLATGRTEAAALAAARRLWEAEKQGAEAVKKVMEEIQGVFDEQAADVARLESAVQRYGFSLEQLGPALRKQKLDEQAKELIEDWRVLVGSGIDVNLVNEKMAESMNAYLKLAITTGAEVPLAMQPILQKMIESGTLLDENGKAITDMGQLQVRWSRTMGQEFDRLIGKLDQMFTRIFGLGTGLQNLPDTVPDPFRDWDVPQAPDMPDGGDPGPPPQDGYHTGGLVTAHKGLFLGNRFKPGEVFAKLLTGEGVLSRSGMRNLGGAGMLGALNRGALRLGDMSAGLNEAAGRMVAEAQVGLRGMTPAVAGGGGGAVTQHVTTNVTVTGTNRSPDEIARAITKHVVKEILYFNTDGTRDKMRRGLR